MTNRLVTVEERRARLGRRQRLATRSGPGEPIASLVDDLVVLHATDPATIFLSVAARSERVAPADVERELYDDRTMLRTLAMRRTLFVATTAMAPIVEISSSGSVAVVERKRLEGFLADTGIDDPTGWLAERSAEVLAALDGGPLAARELTAAVPTLGTKILMGAGTKNPVEAGATSRVLGLMAVERQLVRGRPTGEWTGRQYTWHRRDRWWPDGPPDEADLDEGAASATLLERWLTRFGPATVADMKWWTGWTMTKTRAALAELETVEVTLDGPDPSTGVLLAEDADPVDEPEPWAALLPSLDPTAMGWKERAWYLGPHREPLFDRNGNIGPTVWVDGRIVGGWSQRPDGDVVVELLEPVGSEHRDLIDVEVARIADFVGQTVVRPSFPTPLQKRLSAGD